MSARNTWGLVRRLWAGSGVVTSLETSSQSVATAAVWVASSRQQQQQQPGRDMNENTLADYSPFAADRHVKLHVLVCQHAEKRKFFPCANIAAAGVCLWSQALHVTNEV